MLFKLKKNMLEKECDHFPVSCSIYLKPTEPAVTECNIRTFREIEPVKCAESVAVYIAKTNADNIMLTGFDLYDTAFKTAADEHTPSINTKKCSARRHLWYTNEIHAQRVTRRKYEMRIKSGLEIHKEIYHTQSCRYDYQS